MWGCVPATFVLDIANEVKVLYCATIVGCVCACVCACVCVIDIPLSIGAAVLFVQVAVKIGEGGGLHACVHTCCACVEVSVPHLYLSPPRWLMVVVTCTLSQSMQQEERCSVSPLSRVYVCRRR